LIYPEDDNTGNPRYYVRKFMPKMSHGGIPTASDGQCNSFKITVPGISSNYTDILSKNQDIEVWMFLDKRPSGGEIIDKGYGRRINLGTGIEASNGVNGVGTKFDGDTIYVTNTLTYNYTEPVYIIIKLNNKNAKVTGTVTMEQWSN
jgi:hypothetical protein